MDGAYIYTRVSTNEQVDNYSLDGQEQSCRAWCDRNGLQVVDVFREEGASAKTTNRRQLQTMLEACAVGDAAPAVTTVVVYRMDRLSRDVADTLDIIDALRSCGVRVMSATEQFPDTPLGRHMRTISASNAQLQNEMHGERVTDGMQAAMRAGRVPRKPPYGYIRPPAYRPGHRMSPDMVHDPDAAPFVRRVFELKADGHTLPQIRDAMTALGMRAPKGGPLRNQSITDILARPLYAGIVRSDSWGIDAAGDFEPIISRELFDAAHGERPRRVSTGRRYNNPDFPLRRVSVCGVCTEPITGSKSTGRAGKKYAYYKCRNKDCPSRPRLHVRREDFEGEFVEFLDTLKADAPILDALELVIADAAREREQTSKNDRITLSKRLSELQLRRKRMFDALVDGLYDKDDPDYVRERERVAGEITDVEAALRDAESAAPDSNAAIAFARELMSDLPTYWARIDRAQQGGFARAMFPDGVTYTDGSFGTATTPWILTPIDPEQQSGRTELIDAAKNDCGVVPTGFEPASPP